MPFMKKITSSLPELKLKCCFCNGESHIQGQWSNARVVCTVCKQESPFERYQAQMDEWRTAVCHYLAAPPDHDH